MLKITLFRNNMPFESVPVTEFNARQVAPVLRVQSFKRASGAAVQVPAPGTNGALKPTNGS